MTKAG